MGDETAERRALERVEWPWLSGLAGASFALLMIVASRYGYHRDELYFLEAGEHLAWGYPDQPPYVAVVARSMDALVEGSLIALRTPSALTIAALVVVSGLLARELGSGRAAQVLAATTIATAPVVLGAGHLLSTTTTSLLVWAAVTLLVVRALRTDRGGLWVAAGAVAGFGLLANSNVIFLLAAMFVGLVVAGPRRPLASAWPWVGAAIALACWAPYVAWQARAGWPQLEVSASIAAGESGSSESRAAFLPFQLVLLNPFMAPVWLVGGVRLLRSPSLRWCRGLGWCWPTLAVLFLVTGGKPYYLSGLYPLLLGAGAQPVVDWVGRSRPRVAAVASGFALGLPAIGFALPLVPADRFGDTVVTELNYDLGEQIGWPSFVEQVDAVVDEQEAPVVLLTSNYGEAGALDRYGSEHGLPEAYSGDMGYWHWGPPPDGPSTVVAIGFERRELERAFGRVELVHRIDNRLDVDNDEQGAPIWVCRERRAPWSDLWGDFQRL